MIKFKKATGLFGNFISRIFFTRTKIRALLSDENQLKNAFGQTLNDTVRNTLSDEEFFVVRKIEELRKILSLKNEEVTLTDYGAGRPDSKLSEAEMYQGRQIKVPISKLSRFSVTPKHCVLLLKLILNYKPLNCLELGTSLGISLAYQASALDLNKNGRIISIEGAEPLIRIAEKNLKSLGLKRFSLVAGRFNDVLDTVLEDISPLDYAFIDGHHDERATINYFNKIKPHLNDSSLMVFDDIHWSGGMKKAWATIHNSKDLVFSIDTQRFGICFFKNGATGTNKPLTIVI